MSFFNCTNKDTKEVPGIHELYEIQDAYQTLFQSLVNIESTCELVCLVSTFHLRPLDIASTQLLDTRTPQ